MVIFSVQTDYDIPLIVDIPDNDKIASSNKILNLVKLNLLMQRGGAPVECFDSREW